MLGVLGVLAQMFMYRAHAIACFSSLLSFSIAQIRGQIPFSLLIQCAFHRDRNINVTISTSELHCRTCALSKDSFRSELSAN